MLLDLAHNAKGKIKGLRTIELAHNYLSNHALPIQLPTGELVNKSVTTGMESFRMGF